MMSLKDKGMSHDAAQKLIQAGALSIEKNGRCA